MIQNAKIVGVNVNPEQYHAQSAVPGDPHYAVSSSALRLFAQCPSRWRHGYELPSTQAMDGGSLLDTRLLTPDQFDSRYAVRPLKYTATVMECPSCKSRSDAASCRKCKTERVPVNEERDWNANATVCSEWTEKQAGKEIATVAEVADADAAIARLRENDIIASYLDQSEKQVAIFAEWRDEKTGLVIPIKCLLDLVPKADSEFSQTAGDLKRTRNAAQMPWQSWCFQAGYYIQGAWGLDLLSAATGQDRNTFVFILSEAFKPWEPGRRMLSQDFTTVGRASYTRMIANYCACVAANRWPGYDDTDESVGGWGLVEVNPFQADRAMFAPKYDFAEGAEEAPSAEPDEIGIVP